jgi:hypothetical protein
LDFQKRFPTAQECLDYLTTLRFPPGSECSRCGSTDIGMIRTRALRQCRICREQVSVTAGTMFHRTRTPLQQWFWAIFLTARDKRGHSALQLSKELNVSYDRAWLMMHKIRSAMANRDRQYSLDGIVELDEAYFGAPSRGHIGRSTKRAKALVAVSLTPDNRPRFAKILITRRLDKRSIKSFALAGIAIGSTIRTDGLNAYRCLEKAGYHHEPTVAPSQTAGAVLHWAHIIISNAKAFIAGTSMDWIRSTSNVTWMNTAIDSTADFMKQSSLSGSFSPALKPRQSHMTS